MTRPRSDGRFSIRRFVLAALGTLALSAPLLYLSGALDLAGAVAASPTALRLENPRLVVIKARRVVHLFDEERLVQSYSCDLGTSPAADKRTVGDGRTPLGTFRIVSKNRESPYHRFLGIDYPHPKAVRAGLAAGLISDGAARSILTALEESRCPDWSTPLGGGIGIHGHRQGRDWTGGCIAVSDSVIEELFRILRIGDRVEILP